MVTTRNANQSTSLAPRSLFAFLSAAQIADVQSSAFTLDLTTALNSAFAAGVPLFAPFGVYRHDGQLNIPNTGSFSLTAEGQYAAEFRAGQNMTYQISKDVVANGADLSPVNIENIYLNSNRHANACLRLGAGKGGRLSNIKAYSFLNSGFEFGNQNASTTAAFYENEITKLTADGNAAFVASAPPTRGAWFREGATDNDIDMIVASYLDGTAGYGIDNLGAGNAFYGVHTYNAAYNIRSNIFCQIIAPYSDTMAKAGIRIDGEGIIVQGGMYYWPSGSPPSVGGAVPIEIADALNVVDIQGGLVRNDNGANPYIRLIGSRPTRLNANGMTPARNPLTSGTGDTAAHQFENSIGVRAPSTSTDAVLEASAPTTGKAKLRLKYQDVLRYEFQTDGTAESGANAGSNLVINAYDDSNTLFNALKYFRSSQQWNFNARVQLGASGGRVGFYGVSPIIQATGTPAAATDLPTALTLVNALRADLVALGLIV